MTNFYICEGELWIDGELVSSVVRERELEKRVRELEQQLEAALGALAGMVEEHCPTRRMFHHGHVAANQEAFMVLDSFRRLGWDINLDVYWLTTEAERDRVLKRE